MKRGREGGSEKEGARGRKRGIEREKGRERKRERKGERKREREREEGRELDYIQDACKITTCTHARWFSVRLFRYTHCKPYPLATLTDRDMR